MVMKSKRQNVILLAYGSDTIWHTKYYSITSLPRSPNSVLAALRSKMASVQIRERERERERERAIVLSSVLSYFCCGGGCDRIYFVHFHPFIVDERTREYRLSPRTMDALYHQA